MIQLSAAAGRLSSIARIIEDRAELAASTLQDVADMADVLERRQAPGLPAF